MGIQKQKLMRNPGTSHLDTMIPRFANIVHLHTDPPCTHRSLQTCQVKNLKPNNNSHNNNSHRNMKSSAVPILTSPLNGSGQQLAVERRVMVEVGLVLTINNLHLSSKNIHQPHLNREEQIVVFREQQLRNK